MFSNQSLVYRPIFYLIAMALTLCLAPPVQAEDSTIEIGLERLAAAVATAVKEEGHNSVIVGDAVAMPRLRASGGVGLRKGLVERIEKHGVKHSDAALLQLIPRFDVKAEKEHQDLEHESLGMEIKAELFNQKGDLLKIISITVFGDETPQFTGLTADLQDTENRAEQEKAKIGASSKPQAAIVGAQTRASADSPFGIEIFAHSRGKVTRRTPRLVAGRAFVDLNEGEEYILRLHNHDPEHEAAVKITIDGLSMFEYSEEGKFGERILVPAGKFADVPGWYINRNRSAAFLIASYPDDDNTILRHPAPGSLGTITASFAYAWNPSDSPPPGEGPAAKGAKKITEQGRKIDKKYEVVKREVGRVRAFVSVRYDR